jgi:hypothetical protein
MGAAAVRYVERLIHHAISRLKPRPGYQQQVARSSAYGSLIEPSVQHLGRRARSSVRMLHEEQRDRRERRSPPGESSNRPAESCGRLAHA